MGISLLAGAKRRIALGLVVVAGASVAVLGLLFTPGTGAKSSIDNSSFVGRWSFGADGVIERDGTPGRGFFEVGVFHVDGKGKMTGGVEYSNLLTDDDAVVDQPFTFEGTYDVRPNGTGRARVAVTLPNGAVINKTLWFVLNDFKKGEAHGMYGGHLHAELGENVDGRAGLHHARRIE
jgi:hypothetical protein